MSLRRICDQCHQPVAPETTVLRLVRQTVTTQHLGYDSMVDYGPRADAAPIAEFCTWPCLIAYAREQAVTADVAAISET